MDNYFSVRMVVVILLTLWAVISRSVGGNLQVKLDDTVHVTDTINVIEGRHLKLTCISDVKGATITWTIKARESFTRHDPVLEIDKVRRATDGEYTCSIMCSELCSISNGTDPPVSDSISIRVNILYPPALPMISGPLPAMFEGQLNLSCSSDANPPPSYWWSWSGDPGGIVTTRGDRYQETVLSNWVETFCWAENTMIPTLGDTVTSSARQKYRTAAHRRVHISELSPEYTFAAGSTLDVWCHIYGFPYPAVWWTKDGDSAFSYNGNRFVIENVEARYTGYYTCHIENNITLADGTKQMTTDSRSTLIKIVDPTVPKECVKYIPLPDAQNTTLPTTRASSNNTGDYGDCPSSTADGEATGLIVAAVLGWLLAAGLVVVGIVCWIRHRRTHSKDETTSNPQATLRQPQTIPQYDRKPTLPTRPATHFKSRKKNKSEHIYLDLQPPEEEGSLSYNYDYAKHSGPGDETATRGNRNESSDDPDVMDTPATADDGYLQMAASCKESDKPATLLDNTMCNSAESLTDSIGYEIPLEMSTPDHQAYENTMVTATPDDV